MAEPKLSALELKIMSEFWSRGACSIREVHEAIVKRDRPAYTTVQTMIYRLVRALVTQWKAQTSYGDQEKYALKALRGDFTLNESLPIAEAALQSAKA